MTSFAKELFHFLEAMGLDENFKQGVMKFDFSATKDIAFVHTIGGSHVRGAAQRTGYPLLSRLVRDFGLQSHSDEAVYVTFAASSIGSLDISQIEALYKSLRGESPVFPSGPVKKKNESSASSLRHLTDHFQALFPSRSTVANSKGGIEVSVKQDIVAWTRLMFCQNGGSICMQSQYWDNVKFPKSCFAEYTSRRPGILSHNKVGEVCKGFNTPFNSIALPDCPRSFCKDRLLLRRKRQPLPISVGYSFLGPRHQTAQAEHEELGVWCLGSRGASALRGR